MIHFLDRCKPITTERLYLRSWTVEDMQGYILFGTDPDVMIPAGLKPARTAAEAREGLRRSVNTPWGFAITLRSTGEIIGQIKYQDDLTRSYVESLSVAFELAKCHWGCGYMTEALRAVVRNAFEEYDVDLLVASHFKGNERSKRVIERAGFLFDGYSVCGFRRFDGALLDCVNYSLLREEYESGYISPRRFFS